MWKRQFRRKRGAKMRSLSRLKQFVWFSKVREIQVGIDTINQYSKLIEKKFTISPNSGTPEEISAGIVPTYDRYITSYDREFCKVAEEGMAVWVDKIPKIGDSGNLVLDEEGVPITPPDYTLKKILATQRGKVFRYGISKIGGSE